MNENLPKYSGFHPNVKDITGQRFGNWTVISRSEKKNRGRNVMWLCICDCGVEGIIIGNNLRTGTSTGCRKCSGRKISKSKITHGEAGGRKSSGSRTYRIWSMMRARAASNKTLEACHYAKRDITICERWASYQNFIEDMGYPPSDKHTIDRINNDLGYCKGNCRWATQTQQNRNKSSNRIVEYQGKKMCVAEFAETIKRKYHSVAHLVRLGLPTDQIVERLNKRAMLRLH